MMTLHEGIHPSVPMEVYINDPCPEPSLSASVVPELLVSPLQAKTRHPRLDGGERGASRVADLGSAAHAATLEDGHGVAVINVEHPKTGEPVADYRTKAAQEARDSAYAEGKIPILMHEAPVVETMRESIRRGIEAIGGKLGAAGSAVEQTIIWREKGAWCRARADLIFELDSPPGTPRRPCGICDIKTSKSADPDQWERRVLWPSDHDIRAAWYIRGIVAATGHEVPHVYLVQETQPPYDWSQVVVPGEALHLANQLIDIATEIWGRCLKTNNWPGYPKQPHYATIPGYRADGFEALIDNYRTEHPEDAETFGGKE